MTRGVCIYQYPDSKPSIWKVWALSFPLGISAGVPGSGPDVSGVGCVRQSGGHAPMPLHLQRVWGFGGVPLWQGRQLSIWFSPTIARCLSIAAFTCLYSELSSPCLLSSWISAQGFLLRYCISSNTVRKIPPLAILATFKARHMLDCSSCNQPPCPAIVANLFKTYKKLVTASPNEIQLLSPPNTPV